MKIGPALGLVAAASLAFALRCPQLSSRPMHNDEAVNAIKFGRLWQHGTYNYDPNEHHGPSLYYATLAISRAIGAPDFDDFTETRFRSVTVLFGVGLILLVPLLADGLGRHGSIWAALFTAASPAMVFYSRYYIHEMLLVFSSFLAIAAGWRYWRSRKLIWALLTGIAVGLMHATKETFVLSLAAASLALGINQLWNRWLDATGVPAKAPRLNYNHVAAGFALWFIVWVVAFSSFFSHAGGLVDSFRTYAPWLSRAGGETPHIHPWSFYLHRLLFFHEGRGPILTEALILSLAAVGVVAAFARKGLLHANASFIRFLALYSVILLLAYNVISYKTPWCLLNFWHPMILLAGVGVSVIMRAVARPLRKGGVIILLLIGLGHLSWEARAISGEYAAEPGNPYVYAQTAPDLLNLVSAVGRISRVHPEGNNMLVKIIASDSEYWPLPWYLRRFKRVGWWGEWPSDPYAPVMITSPKFDANLAARKDYVMAHLYALRTGVFLELWVETELWKHYVAERQNPNDQ